MRYLPELYLGDCENILKDIPNDSVDLIFTSPPYANQRKKTYGGIKSCEYVKWFLPKSEEMLRILKPTGTFILNIKENVTDGERDTYVIELILAMKKQGWLWTEEFVWHKKNSFPGKWSNRFRDSWERLLQFNKCKQFNMYQDTVMIPIGDWSNKRLKNLSENDSKRYESKTESGFGRNISNWVGKELVYPTNVIHMQGTTTNKNHSATFPDSLPEWFIKLFTKEDDTVLDPFAGSGTTIFMAHKMNRNSIGIEIIPEYYDFIKSKIPINTINNLLFE